MMKRSWMPHLITAMALLVFVVLGLACGSSPDYYSDSSSSSSSSYEESGDTYYLVFQSASLHPIIVQAAGQTFYLTTGGNQVITSQSPIYWEAYAQDGADIIKIPIPNGVVFKDK